MKDESSIVDDRLRLIFTCCHPALEMPARVALTLRTLGGMTTGEIARAFLVAEPTMGKRIVRAKRKIADAHIPYFGRAVNLASRLVDVAPPDTVLADDRFAEAIAGNKRLKGLGSVHTSRLYSARIT